MSVTTLFLSSTKEDLVPYRDVAIHVAQRLGMQVVAMEDFGPDPRTAAALCAEKIRSANLFLGLYAHRYGFQPEGFGGASMVELEYGWAKEAGLPMLLFMVDDDHPWSPRLVDHGADREKLLQLKARLRLQHVVAPFTTPERLREDLFVHLPRFRTEQPKQAALGMRTLPSPPAPYMAHAYTLLQTEQVIGRERELSLLDSWQSDTGDLLHRARILCLVAIGGMGKSAVTWKWFHERAPNATQPFAGRMWWSFYEADADFDRFLTAALAYCSGQSPEEIRKIPRLDQEARLLDVLDLMPFLLVLDGVERLLIAYAGMDFAHLADDDLDRRTANAVAGARGIAPVFTDSIIGQHRLRKTIDPHVGNFFRKLARVSAARVLMTSRLYPSDLQTVTGHEFPGCAAAFLRGLEPGDAVALWRAMGVSGSDEELLSLFATFDHYPLIIRALAGEVARFRGAPGDFDAWRRAHPEFDPFALPLVQVKSHVLAHALGSLDRKAADVLQTIAGFRSPTDYDVLVDLFAKRENWSVQVLDSVLTQLEDRGLLGWDRRANRYDLHPIVRGVVWTGLDQASREGVFDALRVYFEAVPAAESESITVAEAKPAIELFNALVGLGRLREAVSIFFDRINHKVLFSEDGAMALRAAMLESLFPDGLDVPPPSDASPVYSQLGHTYLDLGRPTDALDCYERAERLSTDESSVRRMHYRFIAYAMMRMGRLREALHSAERSVSSGDTLYEYPDSELALIEALVGRIAAAKQRVASHPRGEYYDPDDYLGRIALLDGDFRHAARTARVQLAEVNSRRVVGQIVPKLLLAEACVNLGNAAEAISLLDPLLREIVARSLIEPEMECRRVLADAFRSCGEVDRAREMLEDVREMANRGGYRLILADTCNVLAEIERDAGNLAAARQAASDAYEYARCDGPPYTYHRAMVKAADLLSTLGASQPA